jgi:hypothetical protein
MLFDVRGRGRKNTIKVIYILLAVLMGGGLVLFGIGGATSGGLVDAITQGGGSSDSGASRFSQRERDALARTRANPKDAPAWAALARARYQQAGIGDNFDASKNTYTAAGRAKLRGAAGAWEKYAALDPPANQAAQVAGIMVQVYSVLNQLPKVAEAQEVIAEARPSATTYENLATYAYAAGQKRKGDLAGDKAIELAPKDEREALKGRLQQAAQAGSGAAGQSSG